MKINLKLFSKMSQMINHVVKIAVRKIWVNYQEGNIHRVKENF